MSVQSGITTLHCNGETAFEVAFELGERQIWPHPTAQSHQCTHIRVATGLNAVSVQSGITTLHCNGETAFEVAFELGERQTQKNSVYRGSARAGKQQQVKYRQSLSL